MDKELSGIEALSFLFVLTSPVTFLVVLVGVPMRVSLYSERIVPIVMIAGLIIWTATMIFAMTHLAPQHRV